MANFEVIVAGSSNNFAFAIIDVTSPGSPKLATVNPGFGGGCSVDADGSRAAVGNLNGGQVALYDLTNPASPVKLGSVSTPLGGVGAISIDGNRVLAGEHNGVRATLIDFTNPSSPTILSTINTGISSIESIALSGSKAVASGPNDFTMDIIDYSNPSNPTRASFDPQLGSVLTVDLAGTLAAVGAQNGSDVALVDVGSASVLGSVTTSLAGIFSISITGSLVAAGSTNSLPVFLIDFSNAGNPTLASFNPNLGGGSTVFRSGTRLAAGAVNGTTVELFAISGNSASLLGTVNSGIDSITSIALVDFVSAGPPPPPPPTPPHLELSATSLAFGSVAVCLSRTQSLTLKNTGGSPLQVSSIATAAPFSASPSSTTIQKGGSAAVAVNFKPAAVGPATGSLTIKSNDPVHPSVSVTLSGIGTPTPPRHLEVGQSSMVFGACLVNEWIGKRLTLTNTSPCDTLTINSISTGDSIFPITTSDPVTLPATTSLGQDTIRPNTTNRYVVAFGPTATGTFRTTLTISSNDPDRPSITLECIGVGVLAKPTSAALVLDRSGSMGDPAPGGSKMDALRSAVGLFADLLPVDQGDFISAVEFNQTADAIVDYSKVDSGAAAVVKVVVHGLSPDGQTSIGAGLNLAFDQLIFNAHTPREVLMVFTDGMENTYPAIADVEPAILSQGMEVYAIGLGDATNISAATLGELAASSNGKFFASDDTLILRKNFVQVLADAFRMNLAGDPVFTIPRGGIIDVPFEVTRCERRLRFTCAWDDPDQELDLELRAPDGTTYTPGSQGSNQLVRYGTGSGYAFYNLALPPLDDTDVIGPQVVGTWTLRVGAGNLEVDQERFTSALVVDSDIDVSTHVSAGQTAGKSALQVDVLHDGQPVPGAQVRVTFRAPTLSAQAILCSGLARERLLFGESPAIGEAVTGASSFTGGTGRSVRIPYRTSHLRARLTEDFRYSASLPRYFRDGIYQIIVETRVPACGGTVTRYTQLSVAPIQLLSAWFTGVSVAPLPGEGSAVKVVVTPRDRAGNLMGIGLAPKMQIDPSAGLTVLRVIDRFDGSYEIQIARPKAARGTLTLTIGDRSLTVHVPEHPGRNGGVVCWLVGALLGLAFAAGYLIGHEAREDD